MESAEIFAKLESSAQREILGKSLFELYEQGNLELGDVTGEKASTRFGKKRYIESQRELLNGD